MTLERQFGHVCLFLIQLNIQFIHYIDTLSFVDDDMDKVFSSYEKVYSAYHSDYDLCKEYKEKVKKI